ncbi:hypothetical protein SAMN05443247_02858 [Bradyrhizobium erythrophlei]|jgi:hypothetical protein|nr:hypothetical protein SAMN05443247_02858 [Bradyrhizobium erythrophlei]
MQNSSAGKIEACSLWPFEWAQNAFEQRLFDFPPQRRAIAHFERADIVGNDICGLMAR